jgi:hypothetical protein
MDFPTILVTVAELSVPVVIRIGTTKVAAQIPVGDVIKIGFAVDHLAGLEVQPDQILGTDAVSTRHGLPTIIIAY